MDRLCLRNCVFLSSFCQVISKGNILVGNFKMTALQCNMIRPQMALTRIRSIEESHSKLTEFSIALGILFGVGYIGGRFW